MRRATIHAIQELLLRQRNAIVELHQGQAYIVIYDDSAHRQDVQNELALILYRWVHSSSVACPLSFAERVAREIG